MPTALPRVLCNFLTRTRSLIPGYPTSLSYPRLNTDDPRFYFLVHAHRFTHYRLTDSNRSRQAQAFSHFLCLSGLCRRSSVSGPESIQSNISAPVRTATRDEITRPFPLATLPANTLNMGTISCRFGPSRFGIFYNLVFLYPPVLVSLISYYTSRKKCLPLLASAGSACATSHSRARSRVVHVQARSDPL